MSSDVVTDILADTCWSRNNESVYMQYRIILVDFPSQVGHLEDQRRGSGMVIWLEIRISRDGVYFCR